MSHASKGTLKLVLVIAALAALFAGTAIWLGVRNERRVMASARASAEPRLIAISALKPRIALLFSAAPEPGGELPIAFATTPTRENAIAIHEEDLADLTAPGSVAFRWCSDTVLTVACLVHKGEWGPGKPMKWQEKPEAARRMTEFGKVRYVFVIRNLSYESPTYEDSFQFRGGTLKAEVFLFELASNLPLLGEIEISASLGSTASGRDLHAALRRQCRESLVKALREIVPDADCDAGTY